MPFGLNGNNIPHVSSYAEAKCVHDNIKPLRGYLPEDPRPLGHRAAANAKTVRMDSAGAVIFKYHATDVVTWYPDESVMFNPWPSKSTATFAHALLPLFVDTAGECRSLTLRRTDGRDDEVYKLSGAPVYLDYDTTTNTYHLRTAPGSDQPLGTVPVVYQRVDRAKANAVYREYNLKAFEQFMHAYIALREKKQVYPGAMMPADDVLAVLKDETRTNWPHIVHRLMANYDTCGDTRKAMTFLRVLLQQKHDTFRREVVTHVTTETALRSAMKSTDRDDPRSL